MRRLSLSFTLAVLAWVGAIQSPPAETLANERALRLSDVPFPERIAGFERGATRDYERQEPGLGQSITYRLAEPRTTATVYVYTKLLRLASVEAGRLARSERDEAVADVRSMMSRGVYKNVEVMDVGEERLPSVNVLQAFATFRFALAGEEQESLLAVSVQRGAFVKVRVTGTPHPGARNMAAKFAAEVAHIAGN